MPISTDINQGQVDEVVRREVDAAVDFMQSGLPRLDPEKHLVYLSNGEVLQLKPIHQLRIANLYNDRTGEPEPPEPPLVEVVYGGKIKRMEPNRGDPDYQALYTAYEAEHEEWNARHQLRIMQGLYLQGIEVGDIPAEFAEEHAYFYPDSNKFSLRYDYICSLVPDEDIEWLVEAITGQTTATPKGVAEAEQSFPSYGRQSDDH